jgi:hypothetical protein
VTVPLKLIYDLTLTQDKSFALPNAAFDLPKVIDEHAPVHNPPLFW